MRSIPFALLAAAALAACAGAPPRATPAADVPPQWHAPLPHDGKIYEFVPPPALLLDTWRELSKRIRVIPDELAKPPEFDSWGQSLAAQSLAGAGDRNRAMREALARVGLLARHEFADRYTNKTGG